MAIAQKTFLLGETAEEARRSSEIKGLRVLIAHPHPMFRHHLRNGLKKLGFEVTEVGDGIALLDVLAGDLASAVKTRRPLLIIADVNLPSYTGIHILTDLRGAGVKIPFILLASGPTRVSAKQVRQLNRAVLVTLPAHWGEFLSVLYGLLYEAGDMNIRGPLYGRPSTLAPPPWMHDQLIEKRVSRDQGLRARERISP